MGEESDYKITIDVFFTVICSPRKWNVSWKISVLIKGLYDKVLYVFFRIFFYFWLFSAGEML